MNPWHLWIQQKCPLDLPPTCQTIISFLSYYHLFLTSHPRAHLRSFISNASATHISASPTWTISLPSWRSLGLHSVSYAKPPAWTMFIPVNTAFNRTSPHSKKTTDFLLFAKQNRLLSASHRSALLLPFHSTVPHQAPFPSKLIYSLLCKHISTCTSSFHTVDHIVP